MTADGRRVGARARQLLVGIDGPEGRTPAHVAYLVAPVAHTWLGDLRDRLARDQRETLAELEAWVESLELLAASHHRSLTGVAPFAPRSPKADVPGTDDLEVSGLSTDQAAERLDCDARSVRRYAITGLLRGRKLGRDWRFDPASVEALRRSKRPAGAT